LCFAANAGENDAAASAPASTISTTNLPRMKKSPGSSHQTNVPYSKIADKQLTETTMQLPDPALLLVTDRRQARRPLAEIVMAALAAGCRWVSLREKDLPEDEQVPLLRTLLPTAHKSGARLMLHGEASLAKLAGTDGVHLSSGSDPIVARALMGPGKLVGVSIHTVIEAEAIDPTVVDYALAGPAFETPSKPGYGPEIGRKGLLEITHVARVPVLAIGGINTARIAEVMAAGCAGVAVMGGVMRAPDPALEISVLIATLKGYPRAE
jgi:thiamine-phosphate pyrophosphorylase